MWKRLVRFTSSNKVYYGEPIGLYELKQAKRIQGCPFQQDYTITSEILRIDKVLSPLEHVPQFMGIGLNYKQHAKELGMPLPSYPILFTKPSHALNQLNDPVVIPKICQGQVDYEGELAVVLKSSCRNVTRETALNHVLGYTCANDITARHWQQTIGQWCFAKSFDQFCPLGPILVRPDLISPDCQLQTRLNGQLVQSTVLRDMVFDVADIISFLSQGTTLEAGSVILTGTPAGVGSGQTPARYMTSQDKIPILHRNRNKKIMKTYGTSQPKTSTPAPTRSTKPPDILSQYRSLHALNKSNNKVKRDHQHQHRVVHKQTRLDFKGKEKCKECGFVYDPIKYEDTNRHVEYHARYQSLYYGPFIWKRVMEDVCISIITQSSDAMCIKKGLEIWQHVGCELGSANIPIQWPDSVKMLMYTVSGRVVGCLMAEPYSSPTPTRIVCGILYIWVDPQHRHKGIATHLLDCLREKFVFGHVLEKQQLAFSQPTDQGKLLAKSYMGGDFHAYA